MAYNINNIFLLSTRNELVISTAATKLHLMYIIWSWRQPQTSSFEQTLLALRPSNIFCGDLGRTSGKQLMEASLN